jgi:hypothetical protein
MRSRLVMSNLLSIMFIVIFLVPLAFSQTSVALISPTCLPTPLPSSSRPPVFTMQTVRFGEQLHFDVWREPCKDNPAITVPLLRATPLSASPFVCSSLFTVIQAGIQYDIRLSSSSTSSFDSFCGDLFVPTTFLIAQHSFDPQFDDSEAFQLVFQGDRDYTLNVDAARPVNWALIPGGALTPSAPAATVFQDNLALFVRGTDDRLYVNWLLPSYQWTGWGLIGGLTPSTPAVTSLDDDLALFVRGEDNQVYVNFGVTGP